MYVPVLILCYLPTMLKALVWSLSFTAALGADLPAITKKVQIWNEDEDGIMEY